MPWNATAPLGSVSVKANRTILQQNTTYIETTMGTSVIGTNTNTTRDHFWNVGANEDGRHRFINTPTFTVGGLPADPVIGAGMDGVWYLKVTNGTNQWFYRTNAGIFQATPTLLTGTVNISGGGGSDWKTLAAVPENVYGEIIVFNDTQKSYVQHAVFSSSTYVRAYSTRLKQVGSSDSYLLEFRNDSTASLNIQARRGDSGSGFDGNWNYRITYWAQ